MTNLPSLSNIPPVSTDPKIIGPGIWFVIHLTARRAKDEQSKQAFVALMKSLAAKFPCEKCRTHINAYLTKNSFEPYWNAKHTNGEENGMFTWSWNFHNTVNTRLGKPYVDYETAWNMYGDGITICTSKCGDEHPPDPAKSTSYTSIAQTKQVENLVPQGLVKQLGEPILPEITIYPNQGPQNFGVGYFNNKNSLPSPLLQALVPTLFS